MAGRRPRSDRRVALHSLDMAGRGEFSLDQIDHDPAAPWTDYVRGMALFLEEAGHRLTGFDGLIHSTVPFASGLSSSAAIEMAAGVAFQAVGGFRIDPVQMALIGQRAENRFVGVNCGILDQYSSALGQAGNALLLDCRHLTSRVAAIAPGIRVVICDTRAERKLTGSEYGERRAQCEEGVRLLQALYPDITALRDVSLTQFEAHAADLPEVVGRRCRFISKKISACSTWRRRCPAASQGGCSSCCRRPTWVRATCTRSARRDQRHDGRHARRAGRDRRARQAGAGFGGCMVALVTRRGHGRIQHAHVEADYRDGRGFRPRVPR